MKLSCILNILEKHDFGILEEKVHFNDRQIGNKGGGGHIQPMLLFT